MVTRSKVKSSLKVSLKDSLKGAFKNSPTNQGNLFSDRSEAEKADHYAAWGKRLFDIVFALTILIVLSPIYLAIALLILISSRGSILYVHSRVGRHGREFKCLKFRTMVVGADQFLEDYLSSCPISRAEYESSFKLKCDPRITKIGRFLRTTSLDELPQFWNVLMGDMSVVGPRPLVQAELARYGKVINQVLSVRPGIAGIWQVSGRNDLPYSRRIHLDASYVRRMSLSFDLWLIFKTILVVVFPRGAY
jgi:lipopolysaccharide/colanic/teichoic acid biosynthesis glycosyltransferase